MVGPRSRVMVIRVQAAYLDTISVCCFYFELVWLGNKVLSKAGTEYQTVLWRCVVVSMQNLGLP